MESTIWVFSLRWNGKENGSYYIILGYKLGLFRDNAKEDGIYYNILRYILGLYRDNGKENGNYYMGFSLRWNGK